MAQVSKQLISPLIEAKIRNLLVDCIRRCQDQDSAADFVDDLLTDTEKTMIAKRVAIALMVLKGYSSEDIEQKLKVSSATVWRVKTWLMVKGKGYRALLAGVIKQDERQQKEHIEALREARESMPRWGTNWKEAKRRQWEKVKKIPKVPF